MQGEFLAIQFYSYCLNKCLDIQQNHQREQFVERFDRFCKDVGIEH